MIQVAYDRLYNHLRERILSGKLKPGMKVPPERQLCEDYGVSRITIRHALRLLQDQGLVDRTPGRGTFVRASRPRKVPITDMDYVHSMKNAIPNMRRVLVGTEEVAPPADVERSLGLLKSEICLRIERLDLLNDEPLSYDRGYVPLDHASSIDNEMLVQLEFLDLWLKREGLVISHVRSSTEAIRADETTAKLLDMSEADPVLLTTEILLTPTGRPVAQFCTHYRGDRFQLVSTTGYGA